MVNVIRAIHNKDKKVLRGTRDNRGWEPLQNLLIALAAGCYGDGDLNPLLGNIVVVTHKWNRVADLNLTNQTFVMTGVLK